MRALSLATWTLPPFEQVPGLPTLPEQPEFRDWSSARCVPAVKLETREQPRSKQHQTHENSYDTDALQYQGMIPKSGGNVRTSLHLAALNHEEQNQKICDTDDLYTQQKYWKIRGSVALHNKKLFQ